MISACIRCEKPLTKRQIIVGNKYCGKKCFDLSQRRPVVRTCIVCGKEWVPDNKQKGKNKTCSRECFGRRMSVVRGGEVIQHSPEMKKCKKCHEVKSLSEFSLRKDSREYRSDCKQCRVSRESVRYKNEKERISARNLRWQQRNLEKVKLYRKRTNQKSREKHRAYYIEWRKQHAEKMRTYSKKYYENNREKERARGFTWYVKNREQMREISKRYYQTERGKISHRLNQAKRRTRKMLGEAETVTIEQWQEILDYFGFRCAYCYEPASPLTQDHLEPLRVGGRHEKNNIVPACRSCNSSKHHKPLSIFLLRKTQKEEALLRKL